MGWLELLIRRLVFAYPFPLTRMETMTVTIIENGIERKVELEIDAELAAAIEAEKNIKWCECEDLDANYVHDGECNCGIHKHHYHCRKCLLVSQIG